MTLLSDNSPPPPIAAKRGHLPHEVEFILSALEAGQFDGPTRRRMQRRPYRVAAYLKLFSDNQHAQPWPIFVRDIDQKGLGFVTRHRLPLGYGGILNIESPQGRS